MADRFYLDPDAARRTASTSKASADRLRSAYAHLTSTLDQHDGCWGGDDIGKNFADGYVANATTARTDIGQTLDGLDNWSEGITSAVDGFTELDEQNADQVDKADHDFANQLEHPPAG